MLAREGDAPSAVLCSEPAATGFTDRGSNPFQEVFTIIYRYKGAATSTDG